MKYFTKLFLYYQQGSKSFYYSGSGCSKLTTSLINISLNFQTLVSTVECQYFLLKQKLLSFFQIKISVFLVIKS